MANQSTDNSPSKLVLFGPKNPEAMRLVAAIQAAEELAGKPKTEILGFLHSDPALKGTTIFGLPIFGEYEVVPELAARGAKFVSLVASNTPDRYRTAKQIVAAGGQLGQLIHPTVDQSWARVGAGSYIQEGVVLQAEAQIGNNCSIHMGTLISHEARIGHSASITHAVSISGAAQIGDGVYIGTNATILPSVRIGNWVTIGAGAVVLRDVPDFAVVVGNPAQTIKYKPESIASGDPCLQ